MSTDLMSNESISTELQVESVPFANELDQLQTLGYSQRSHNLNLLKKTNGNVGVVKKLLEAREEFRDAVKSGKKDYKSSKEDYKLKKRFLKECDDEELKGELKEDKKQMKDERHALKKQKKELKKVEKDLKKEGKREKKSERKFEKYQRKDLKTEKTARIDALPSTISQIYLDGNNMLFVLGSLRTRVLNKNRNEAEELFELMAKSWVELTPQVKKCTLIFDSTHTNKTELDGKLKVCSARPHFPTSDHALIQWSQNATSEEKPTIAVFTSDRALTEELVKAGVNVYKPKSWFTIVARAFGEKDEFPNLDDWSEKWLAQSLQKVDVNKNN